VVGAALAQRAARELQDDAGIPSQTIASLLTRLRDRPMTTLPRRAVLVVDEAGMVSTRELAELLEHADRVHTKVVLVGDHRQLAEIDAGGAFGALAARLPAIGSRRTGGRAPRGSVTRSPSCARATRTKRCADTSNTGA
jgi:ATP-dependent exoDNAse (exonuclease V) alpha subunit